MDKPQATGFSHLRAVLGLDTLLGYQLGSQRLSDHKAGHSLGLLCNAPHCRTSCVGPGYRRLYIIRRQPEGMGHLAFTGQAKRSQPADPSTLDACLLGLMKLREGLPEMPHAAFLGAQCGGSVDSLILGGPPY